MPLYTFMCKKNHVEEHYLSMSEVKDRRRCKCGRKSYRQFSRAEIISFKEDWYPNLDLEPVHCSTPQQLRDECRKRGLISEYVEGNSVWRTKSGRWV